MDNNPAVLVTADCGGPYQPGVNAPIPHGILPPSALIHPLHQYHHSGLTCALLECEVSRVRLDGPCLDRCLPLVPHAAAVAVVVAGSPDCAAAAAAVVAAGSYVVVVVVVADS